MANILDVAGYILEKKGSMSTWKLQKLCYYAQAWELAWTDNPLFTEEFQAWGNGPVCEQLYDVCKGKLSVSASDILYNTDNLTEEQKEDINIILKDYGEMEPYDLQEHCCSESPWKEAMMLSTEEAKCTVIITKENIQRYYQGLLVDEC